MDLLVLHYAGLGSQDAVMAFLVMRPVCLAYLQNVQ